jgi:hypothetical protein
VELAGYDPERELPGPGNEHFAMPGAKKRDQFVVGQGAKAVTSKRFIHMHLQQAPGGEQIRCALSVPSHEIGVNIVADRVERIWFVHLSYLRKCSSSAVHDF